jgi:hypothetical protein
VQGVVTNVGQQWRNPKNQRAIADALAGIERSRYYRDAGFLTGATEVLRQHLRMPPSPYRHVIIHTPKVVGLDPDRLEATEHTHW